MSFKKICVCLILIFCLIGAASAAEDVSTDLVDASADAVVVDAVSDDVSDSVESAVVEDEPVVDESALAQDVELEASVDDELAVYNPDILSDWEEHEIIYVNISSKNDPESDDVHGQSWEDAYGGIDGLYMAFTCLTENGVIYVANGDYLFENYGYEVTLTKGNFTIIGQGHLTNITNIVTLVYGTGYENSTKNFINLTLTGKDFGTNSNFINCTFLGPISISKDLNINHEPRHVEEYGYAQTYFMNFENCTFKDVTTTDALVTLYKYGAVNFNNCTFENIVADSIVYHNDSGYFEDDGITFKECTFKNSDFNGVVDSVANFDDAIAIEDCNYDGPVAIGTTEVNGHFYVNATKLAKAETTLTTDIDNEGNLLVSLTDASGSAVANAKVLISVNDGEDVYDLGEDGTLSIALADLADATGKLNIVVTFEETDDYKGSSDTISTVLVVKTVTETIDPVATAITASDITATAKIAKTLSITLKDANGNALANKAVQVTVNGKTSTVKTDSKGVAKVTVNYAKAGTYYYTFTYLGDNDYKASLKPVKVTVNKQATKATFAKKTFKVKATKKISFTLKDSKGKAIAKKKITFKVNGKTYTAKTNSKGVATVKIVIKKKGKYTATAKFAGDTTYKAISKKVKITIK